MQTLERSPTSLVGGEHMGNHSEVAHEHTFLRGWWWWWGEQLKHCSILPTSLKSQLQNPHRGPTPLTCPMAKSDLSKRVKEKRVLCLFTLGKTLNPKDKIHVFEVHVFCDLFVGKRKSPSYPKAMDAINRAAEMQPASPNTNTGNYRALGGRSATFVLQFFTF